MATDYQMSPEMMAYLEDLQKKRDRMANPDYVARAEAPAMADFAQPEAIANLGNAFSKFGTLGGKSGDAGALQDNAAALQQQGAMDKKNYLARQNSKDQQSGLQLSVMQHLNDKYMAGQANKDRMQEQAALAQQKAQEDRQFKMAEGEKDRQFKREMSQNSADLRRDMIAAKPPKNTAEEKNSAYHASRAADAVDLLSQIEKSGYDPADYGRAARNMRIPLIGATPLANQDDRAYKQAQEEFIASVLRKESGAAVSPQEFERYSTIYFPAAGDNEQIIKQKSVARDRAVQNLKEMAGAAYDPAKRTQFAYKPEGQAGTAIAAPAKVRVKSPDGKVGSIPAEDLEDALKEGYQEIK